MSYKESFDGMIVAPKKKPQLDLLTARILKNKSKYDEVSQITNVPWYVLGAIHYRESSLNFSRHLHNGDPLTARTKHVPAGRPIKGQPPFTWVESAIDAIKLKGWDKVKDWSIENTLNLVEAYNGLGYKKKGLPSPYLWSWSDKYQKGKYVADGKFDPNYIDQQCGAAILIKSLA